MSRLRCLRSKIDHDRLTSKSSARCRRYRAAALALASATTLISLGDFNSASASVRTFTATAAGASWAAAANWSPAAVPTAADSAVILDGGSIALTGAQSIQTLAYTGSADRTVGNVLAAASSLQLNGNGTDPLVNVTSTGNFTLSGPSLATGGVMNVVLNSSGDFNVVNASTTLTVTSNIGETGAPRTLNINGSGGLGTVILGGTSTFTGGINLVNGALQLNTALSTNGTVPNALSFSGGRLELNNGVTVSGLTSSSTGVGIVEALSGSTLNVTDFDVQDVYSGQLRDGAGVLSLTHAGNGTLELDGDGSNFTGTVTNIGGTLFANHGPFTGSSTARKLGNGSNSLIMVGGTLQLQGSGSSPGPEDRESFSSTALNGSDSVFAIIPGGNLTSIDLGTLTHSTTATADFRAAAFGGGGGGQITASIANDATGILGGWATYLGNDWATVNGSNQIVPFQSYAFKDDPGTWAAGDHVSYVSSVGHVGASTVITSLRLDGGSFPFIQPTLNIDSGATLTVNSGGIINTDHALFGTINGPGTLTSGTSTLIVHTNSGGVLIGATIANNSAGAVTVIHAGTGDMQMTGTNTYTGDTVINAGRITLDPASTPATFTNKGVPGSLGAGNNIVLNNGTLTLQAAFANNPQSTDRDIQISGYSGIDVYGVATFSGVISDPLAKGALNLSGSGQIYLTNTGNNYRGGTRINSGYVHLTNGDALGNAAGSILMGGGTLIVDSTMSFPSGRTFVAGGPSFSRTPVNIAVSGTNTATLGASGSAAAILGVQLVKSGTGTFTMGLNTNNECTQLRIVDGIVAIAGEAQAGAVPTTLVPDAVDLQGGTLRFYSSGAQGLTLNANRGVQVDTSGTLDFAQSSGTPFIQYPISGFGRLYKNGPATVSSNVSHSFAGGLDIVEGRWNVTVPGAAGTGSIIMEGGNTGASPRDGNGQILAIAQIGIGSSGLNLTLPLSNDILLVGPVGSGTNSFEVNTGDNLVLNGVISGTGGFGKGQVANTIGTLTLGGSNTYSGPTNITLGTLALGANDVVPDSSAVTIATAASMFVNGHSETIGSLLGAGTVDLGTGGALSVGADNTAATYSGVMQGDGSVTKVGAGTATFSGANTYTGLTIVKAGNLALTGASAQGRVLTGGGADIQGGRLVFNDNASATTIKNLLKTSFQSNGFNNTSQIRSSTADSHRGLGYLDDGTHFTVAYTYFGDADLSGAVDTSDFTAMSQHFANTNLATAGSPTWSEGDFNYDGVINAMDFNAIASNFGAPSLAAPPALGSLVPEPAALSSLCAGLVLLKRRARRH